MINKDTAAAIAYLSIADLVGRDYFRSHFNDVCHCYPSNDCDDLEYEYFMGFEGNAKTGVWTVFARVSVNRETEKVTLLDYKLPNGNRMENPIKPTSFA
ncbi:hypothetical protein [Ruminococcus albus]|uniref:Uncharacterized protein n=1 Tax=Ruminococcus albus TaxID=1264 RepID=A0A1H7LUW2_RUMAL|nr:hypothetical protein [Ruminococcus albus]SEL02746.1 hypothetical protein SAMN05216469_11016 [Ruminococcus albus]